MKYKVIVENDGKKMIVTLMIKHNGKKFKYITEGKNLKNIADDGLKFEKELEKTFGKKDSKKIIKRFSKDFD